MDNNQRQKGAVRVEPHPTRQAKLHRGAEQFRLNISDQGRSYLRHHQELRGSLFFLFIEFAPDNLYDVGCAGYISGVTRRTLYRFNEPSAIESGIG